jgi:hypothetical protein
VEKKKDMATCVVFMSSDFMLMKEPAHSSSDPHASSFHCRDRHDRSDTQRLRSYNEVTKQGGDTYLHREGQEAQHEREEGVPVARSVVRVLLFAHEGVQVAGAARVSLQGLTRHGLDARSLLLLVYPKG